MEILPRQLLLGVCAVALVAGLAHAAYAETPPVVVGLAMCSGCTRKNMNAEAAFKGLQVAVKCKNSRGEYEKMAVGKVDKFGAFSVPLAAELVGEDGELKQDCFVRLHSASSAPCPGQEPSKIVAAQPTHDGEKMFVALAGKVHRPSAECASAFLCDPFHKHHHHIVLHPPVIVPPKHDHDHSLPPVHVSGDRARPQAGSGDRSRSQAAVDDDAGVRAAEADPDLQPSNPAEEQALESLIRAVN